MELQHRPLGCLQNQRLNLTSTDSPLQRIKEKSRDGISVSTPHRRYGHRLRTPLFQTPFPRLQYCVCDCVSKGFLQREVLGKVSVLEGGSSVQSFWRSLAQRLESFWRSFGACFAGTEQQKLQQKLQPKSPTPLPGKAGEN